MADVTLLTPKILKFEGGFVNDPADRGGATNMGVTLSTWQKVGYDKNGDGIIDAEDIKLLTVDDVTIVLKKFYWDKWNADNITSQSIAEILVDWVWASGANGIKIPQGLLGLKQDGIVGAATLAKVNDYPDQEDLFNKIKQARIDFVKNIVAKDPTQKRFINGWTRRINSYTFLS